MSSLTQMKLFGRELETSSIETFLTAPPDRHRIMVLRGDPGCGKTALLESVITIEPLGSMLKISGLDALRHVEFAASMSMLNRLAFGTETETLLARILADPGTRVLPIQLFEATRRLLEGGAWTLLIDDLQWLDELSLGLVLYLLKNSTEPSRVIAASRPGVSASAFLEEVKRVGLDPVVVEVGPLDETDGTEMAMALRPDLSPDAARSVWERSGGLPYWVIALSADREQTSSEELLTSRLRGAGLPVISLLVHLAVLGRSVSVESLGSMLGWDTARVDEAVLDLESRGLIRRRFDQVSLIHDLVREEALDQTDDESRKDAHLRISRYLEDVADSGTETRLEALHHRLEAGAPARQLALDLLQSPRRDLLGQGGLTDLARAADQPGPEDADAFLLRRGVAELANDIAARDTASNRWLAVLERSNDPVERTWAACQMSRIALRSDDFGEARRCLEMTRVIPDHDDLNRIEIATLEAGLLLYAERRQREGSATAAEAMANARELGLMEDEYLSDDWLGRGPTVKVDVLQAAYDSATVSADQLKSLEVALMMVEAARSEMEKLGAVLQQGRALMRVGRPVEARLAFQALWQRAHEMALMTLIARLGPAYARSLYETGHLSETVRVASEVVSIGEPLGFPRAAEFAREDLALSTLIGGDWRGGIEAMRAAVDREDDPHFRMTRHQMVYTYLSRASGTRSAPDIVSTLIAGWTDSGLALCARCASEFALAGAEASARAGMRREAERWLARFRETEVPLNPLIEAKLLHAEALIDGDPELLNLSRERFADMGYEIEQLWIGLDLAAARAAQPGRSQAAETYREVAEAAEGLGAITIQMLAEKALRELGVRTWRRTASADVLHFTGREMEVAMMAADGLTNREIAESLFLSKKTVERHLSNILAKAGVRNRVELAGLVARKLADQ